MTPDEIRRVQGGRDSYNDQNSNRSRYGGNSFNDDARYGGFGNAGNYHNYGLGNTNDRQGSYGHDNYGSSNYGQGNYGSSNYGQENYGNSRGSYPSYTDYDRGNRGQQQGQGRQSWNEQGGNRNNAALARRAAQDGSADGA